MNTKNHKTTTNIPYHRLYRVSASLEGELISKYLTTLEHVLDSVKNVLVANGSITIIPELVTAKEYTEKLNGN